MTRQLRGIEYMKKYSSEFRMAIAAITATAMCLGASYVVAQAQDTSNSNVTTELSAVRVAQVNPANPSGVFPVQGGVGPGAQAAALPYGVGEVVKMYQGGISKDIIINYINSTALPYHLTADQIIYMQTLGMPQEITKAMILRDGQLQQQGMHQPYPQNYPQQPMPPPSGPPNGYGYGAGQPPPQVAAPSTPPPDVTVVGSDYPVYDAGYPYYGDYGWPYYGYYGWPGYVGGWGWGRGWGGYGGFRGGFGGFRGGVGGFHGGVGGFHGAVGGGGFHGGGGGHGGGGHR
jgi:uncharacterized membrane protein YgcG